MLLVLYEILKSLFSFCFTGGLGVVVGFWGLGTFLVPVNHTPSFVTDTPLDA
jgi:hypothetical protein